MSARVTGQLEYPEAVRRLKLASSFIDAIDRFLLLLK